VPDALFHFAVDAAPETVLRALTTTEGIKGFWTSVATVPAAVGETIEVEFAIASQPFDLLLEQADSTTVVWRPLTFPQHWVGTKIHWFVQPRDGVSTVAFRHGPFAGDGETGAVAYTWGQIMVRLKEYAESGVANPVFV
jgi:uncharacterized protein YndB with AHSA1/START domain